MKTLLIICLLILIFPTQAQADGGLFIPAVQVGNACPRTVHEARMRYGGESANWSETAFGPMYKGKSLTLSVPARTSVYEPLAVGFTTKRFFTGETVESSYFVIICTDLPEVKMPTACPNNKQEALKEIGGSPMYWNTLPLPRTLIHTYKGDDVTFMVPQKAMVTSEKGGQQYLPGDVATLSEFSIQCF